MLDETSPENAVLISGFVKLLNILSTKVVLFVQTWVVVN